MQPHHPREPTLLQAEIVCSDIDSRGAYPVLSDVNDGRLLSDMTVSEKGAVLAGAVSFLCPEHKDEMFEAMRYLPS